MALETDEIVNRLRAIAEVAYQHGSSTEKGWGRLGKIGDRVVKFNTHYRERHTSVSTETRAAMETSCYELRMYLHETISAAYGGKENMSAAAKKVMEKLGITQDKDNEPVCEKSLLKRSLVATLLNTVKADLARDPVSHSLYDKFLNAVGGDTRKITAWERVAAGKTVAAENVQYIGEYLGSLDENANENDKNGYVAHYGFQIPRMRGEDHIRVDVLKRGKGFSHSLLRIDDLNCHLGIGYGENCLRPSIGNYGKMFSSIRKGGSLKNVPEGRKNLVEKWRLYLAKNTGRLNVFKRIRQIQLDMEDQSVKSTGWLGIAREKGLEEAVRQMVVKNLQADVNLDDNQKKLFVDVLIEFSSFGDELMAGGKLKVNGNLMTGEEALRNKISGYCEKHIPDETLRGAWCNHLVNRFDEMLGVMFFRQTSKLGLDFFKEQGLKVAFEWTDWDEKAFKALTKTDQLDARLADKWWKEENPDPSKHHGAPITYSEMRHVLKKDMIKDGIVKPVLPQKTDRKS